MTESRRSARDITADVIVVGVSLFIVLLAALDAHASGLAIDARFIFAVVISVLGCLALLWRRTWPVHIAVGLIPVALVTDFAGMATVFAVFAVAARRSIRATAWVTAVHVAVVVTYYLRADIVQEEQIAYIVFSVIVILLVAGWGRWVHNRRRHLAELREQARHTTELAASEAERVRSLERERIAREMHDSLAHRISMVGLHAGALEVRPDASPEEVTKAAAIIRTSARQALDDLREILGVLRDNGEDTQRPQPEIAELTRLVDDSRSAGHQVLYSERIGNSDAVPESLGRTVYRVVQEGLTNARKHAPRETVTVTLERDGDDVHVHIHNPLPAGPAAGAAPGTRQGLIGMEERVGLAGGTVRSGIRRGASGDPEFHLEVWIPWRQ
ncbi:sensor histidine kinase [Hoyosella subflava]|uniref:histidine kinase n=1 Tax=Hoyosella subflava (strain DSM 45089 / JCM 17490 / NBRC 109087 / DQS3-9A1) TaxID=443218 RepID=F6ELS9_HOYSD|nr:histidine kinase [Hoyosella subflava]AEF41527.1 Two-component sensor kinase [Hoyosella subflava DQS3-9A1]